MREKVTVNILDCPLHARFFFNPNFFYIFFRFHTPGKLSAFDNIISIHLMLRTM